MKMKSKLAIIGTAAAVLSALTGVYGTAAAYSTDFILCEYNGKIALFEDGSNEPLAVYRTSIESLYPADVELLQEGIHLKSRAEVSRLIEDLDLE